MTLAETTALFALLYFGVVLVAFTVVELLGTQLANLDSCPKCGADRTAGLESLQPWELSAGGWAVQCTNCGNLDPRMAWLRSDDPWAA